MMVKAPALDEPPMISREYPRKYQHTAMYNVKFP